ncbi:MAG: DUF1015 domain-containing protein [Flavobacteriales bacterium]|nr:DUF1015 domain-containing protein [Flavobacteriales bacterium]
MAHIRPFRAVRPPRDKVGLVGSRSYLTYSEPELEARLNYNPYSFLHVIKPELHEGQRKSLTTGERFRLVKEGYRYFRQIGIFTRDERDNFYVYRQTKGARSYTGIIAGVSVKDYETGHVKIHEQTITSREALFEQYLRATGFNAEPVLLAYPDRPAITQLVNRTVQQRAEYEFTTTDMVMHEMWMLDDDETAALISEEMAAVKDVYIADGHHRCASSALLARHLRPEHGPWEYFMAMLLPESELEIFDYNRLVTSLNGMTSDEFVEKLKRSFDIRQMEHLHRPTHRGNISMYLKGTWYSLEVKPELVEDTVVGRLDASVLTDRVLSPLLDIHDLKTDERISFLDGTKGLHTLADAVDSGMFAVAFALHPVSIEQLKEVADTGNIMPPKTTWIEPKLRSGVLIYEFDENG